MTSDVLSPRALGRAALARQLLLERADMPVLAAVDHLVGLQAQEPHDPYLALWSRLAGFEPDQLGQLLVDRAVVRIVAMRGTLHLLTAEDCRVCRPLAQPILDRELRYHRDYSPELAGIDLAPVMDVARRILSEAPRTGPQLRAALQEHFPEHHPGALAFACRNLLPLVQVPPRGLWGQSRQVTLMLADAWLGRPMVADLSVDDLVLRYVAAFGPATVADAATWSGLTGLREVVARLRPKLRSYRDERGRELVDLPDAPRPDPEVPAPTRILPDFDNVLLSHADRSRFVSEERRRRIWAAAGRVRGSVLHDGALLGTWRLDRDRDHGSVTLVVDHFDRLDDEAETAVAKEGLRMLGFTEAAATAHDVRFAPFARDEQT